MIHSTEIHELVKAAEEQTGDFSALDKLLTF